jgi:phthalate 4,5-cis-dihydrodiol dehydrogenase
MRKLKLGAAGLGRAFALMAPAFALDPRVELVAAADPRDEARVRFRSDFGGEAFPSVEALVERKDLDAVYVATPHQFHAGHARLAAAKGKHLLVEKPMALSVTECRSMIDAAHSAGVQLIVGHSHSFDAPIRRAREIIESGAVGRVRMITALQYTDFLYRPRRPEELAAQTGGGAVYNQAAHQVDIVRLLAGSPVKSVRAATGAWDPARPVEGAYACFLDFEDGSAASLVYSGYAHFDSDEFCGWIGELGRDKDPHDYGSSRRTLRSAADELALKSARNYGGADFKQASPAPHHQHFGLVIASCERADLRPQPDGVMIYGDAERRLDPLPTPQVPRVEVIDELYGAIIDGRAPVHSGEWALATIEVCAAIQRSARERKEIPLANQTASRT